jgi:protein SCO1/2
LKIKTACDTQMKPIIHNANGKSPIKLLVIVTAIAMLTTYLVMQQLHNRRFPEILRGFAVDPKPVGMVELINKDGQALQANYFKGKWTLVFFGYTNCPDVCPSTLLELSVLKKSLDKAPANVAYQYLFVTVDPQRDTQSRVKEYVEYFNKRFDAASGELAQIKSLESVFGASHRYAKHNDKDLHYAVAHSAEIYIVDPNAQYVGKFLPPFNVDTVTSKLTELSNFIRREGNNA